MSFSKFVTDIRSSLWFVPALIALASMALATGCIEMDLTLGDMLSSRYPRLFGAGAEGSRQLLSAIASSTITVAGVVFSITIVALSLTAAQYSPRVLRHFMSDRPNQVVLGVFVGVFVYCILVLRTIRGSDDYSFVPHISILVAIILALVSIGFLIFFIHHIATAIQISEIAARIAGDAISAVESTYAQEARPQRPPDELRQVDEGVWNAVLAETSGYLQLVNPDALIQWAHERGRVVRMELPVGEFIVKGEPLLSVSGEEQLSREDTRALSHALTINTYRDVGQDPAFGIQQLVDIALKALSPGVNDTGTARDALNYIVSILREISLQATHERSYCLKEGRLVLIKRMRTFASLVHLTFGPIRRNSIGNVEMTVHTLKALALLAAASNGQHAAGIFVEEVDAVEEAASLAPLTSGDKLKVAHSVREAYITIAEAAVQAPRTD